MPALSSSDLTELTLNALKITTPIVAGIATGWFRQRSRHSAPSMLIPGRQPKDRLDQIEKDLAESKATQLAMHSENKRQMKRIRLALRRQTELSDKILNHMLEKSI